MCCYGCHARLQAVLCCDCHAGLQVVLCCDCHVWTTSINVLLWLSCQATSSAVLWLSYLTTSINVLLWLSWQATSSAVLWLSCWTTSSAVLWLQVGSGACGEQGGTEEHRTDPHGQRWGTHWGVSTVADEMPPVSNSSFSEAHADFVKTKICLPPPPHPMPKQNKNGR